MKMEKGGEIRCHGDQRLGRTKPRQGDERGRTWGKKCLRGSAFGRSGYKNEAVREKGRKRAKGGEGRIHEGQGSGHKKPEPAARPRSLTPPKQLISHWVLS